MEYSSPLAAMRPQPVPTWGGRRDLPASRSLYHGYQTFGTGNFDFNTMSMQRERPKRTDYFSLRPVRGSSPTASLTADLDANFHIDKRYPHLPALRGVPSMLTRNDDSPQAPTPRRSLFTTSLFQPRENAGEWKEGRRWRTYQRAWVGTDQASTNSHSAHPD